MESSVAAPTASGRWLDRVLSLRIAVNAETLVVAGLLLAAILTRFHDLGARVMSHDESLHTYYSYRLETGQGFQHTPLMHGPMQFHLIALSYFLFGDSDATARIPAAMAGIAAVGLLYFFKRWLGTTGALVAAAMMLFSPYMLYYSRYVRNESFVVVEALLTFLAVFRYFESRNSRWLYLLVISVSLHFTTKETAFIYTAQLLAFLAGYLVWQLVRRSWINQSLRSLFLIGAAVAVVGSSVSLVTYFRERAAGATQAAAAQPLDLEAAIEPGTRLSPVVAAGAGLALVGLAMTATGVVGEFRGKLRTEFPALDLLLVIGTMVLPQLGAIPANMLGWDPLAYQDPAARGKTLLVVLLLIGVSLAIGWAWDLRRWLPLAGAFYFPFFLFFTTLFTNSDGVATGLVGSLGYWLVQHGVRRGSQPAYYYALIQLPFYEFLPVVGSLIALFYGLRSAAAPTVTKVKGEAAVRSFPVLPMLAFWALTSLLGYSFAGERMPWLTVHIALPLILLAGWGIGRFLESLDWRRMLETRGWLIAGLVLMLVLSLSRAVGSLLGSTAPFAGSTLEQLRVTNAFIASAAVAIGSLAALISLGRGWDTLQLRRLAGLIILGVLTLLSIRAAFRAAYINYDNAKEFLVYAHGAAGVKTVMSQVEDLSRRTTDGLAIQVAFDDDVSWPVNWYMRSYPNALYYGPNPSRDLLNYPVVIAGDNNWAKVDPLMADRYYSFEYIRMVWPMQDYFGLTLERLGNALISPATRAALWDIWLNRDYTAYAAVTGRDFSLENWTPSDRMKLYIRKDIAGLIWDYGVTPNTLSVEPYVDPYADLLTVRAASELIGGTGTALGQFSGPRGMSIAPNGDLYVADTANSRIEHFSSDGEPLGQWGSLVVAAEGQVAPAGSFNEPWDVAVAPDGTVFVADTWNHRIQHFTADGDFLGMFGVFGQTGEPTAFWGPRAVTVDQNGRLFVVDTGNKRVVVFGADGAPLGQFGGFGLQLGSMDEPVGIAVDSQGRIFVADTWNQRVQVFEELGAGNFIAAAEWPIDGWLGQSLNNKPYLAVSADGLVCLSDPEGYRILCFNPQGEFQTGWGSYGAGEATLGLPAGLGFTADNQLWVVDGGNDRLMLFETQ